MNVRLTRSDWKAVLEAAITIAKEWDRERQIQKSSQLPAHYSSLPLSSGYATNDRGLTIRRYIETEIETLELLYHHRDPQEPLIEMPAEIEKELSPILWKQR